MKRLVALATLALVLLVGVTSAATAQQSPEAVALAYVDAVRTKGMTVVPEFIHPDELQRFRDMLLPVITDTNSQVGQNLARAFFGADATAESVKAMAPADFMRGVMSLVDAQMKGANVSIGRVDILGSVKEGETVHLVTRNFAGAAGVQLTELEVISLKPYQDTWKLLLSGELEGLAQALRGQATTKP